MRYMRQDLDEWTALCRQNCIPIVEVQTATEDTDAFIVLDRKKVDEDYGIQVTPEGWAVLVRHDHDESGELFAQHGMPVRTETELLQLIKTRAVC